MNALIFTPNKFIKGYYNIENSIGEITENADKKDKSIKYESKATRWNRIKE